MLITSKHIVLFSFLFLSAYTSVSAQEIETKDKKKEIEAKAEIIPKQSLKSLTDSTLVIAGKEMTVQKDTIVADSVPAKKPKESFSDIIDHAADDYIEIDIRTNTTKLYNNAKLHYQDIDLEAGIIIIDYKNNLITARGIIDSTGYTQIPFFRQGKEESTQDSILVNYKTKKALIWGAESEQDNGILVGSGISKKVNDSTIYVRDIVITTSKKKNPDYYIGIKKAKIIPQKKIIAGASKLYIADVPTPLWLPFAYFPLSQSRTSGILMPTYGENARQGYFLQNGGYYFSVSNYFDLALTGDIYTNGSWGFRAHSNYALRYRFSGNLAFSYESNVNSLRGFDDYSKSTSYNIRWSHSQAAQANPNSRFSASVNLGSSKFYRETLNQFASNARLNNQLSSSVSFSKRFVGTPFNMSLTARHSQNTNTEQINMTLPSLQLSMDKIFPFRPKNGSAKNAFQKIGLSYNMSGDYNINTTDEHFLKKEMFNGARKGIQHTASLSTNMKLLKYFTVSPSANYKERWYFDYLEKKFDEETNTVQTDTLTGFKALREFSTSLSLSTNIYGTVNMKKGRLKAIRHTIRPSVSYSFRPDFSFYDEEVFNPETGEMDTYSPYQGAIYGVPGKGVSNSIGINVSNSFEAKIMSKDSTDTKPKKINLLNNLNFSTGYNMSADTLRWSPVSMSTGANFFKNKLRVNVRATLDPYAISSGGRRINIFNINNGGSLFRLTSAGMSVGYSLSNKSFSKEVKDKKATEEEKETDLGIAEENMLDNNRKNQKETKKKITKLYYSKIPWTLNLSYSLQYANQQRQNELASNSLDFNGSIEFSPKWNVGFRSSYDFKGKGLGHTSLNFQRDLDSWRMSFSWVPLGNYRTYYFFIGVKSSVLSDLKYDKRKLPDKQLF